jgi:hypothetical protein
MNRLAIVMAADSASTVTHYTDHGSEERYFKGANKIFQLSDHHPVGLMIFDSADILRVPWEIVVKAFRANLSKKSFNTLQEYAAEFFSFLEQSPKLFPSDVQKIVFLENARSAAIRSTMRDNIASEVEADRIARNDSMVKSRRAYIDSLVMPPNIDAAHTDQTISAWRGDLVDMINEWADPLRVNFPSDMNAFAELGILEVLKDPGKQLGATGLVFAGFGDDDIFPAFVEYTSCGIVAGKHVSHEIKQVAVSHDLPAWLDSFAQTDMCDTFSLGISRDVYISVMDCLNEGLADFAKSAVVAAGADAAAIPDIKAVVDVARRSMGEAIMTRAKREHALPLRRVLGVLPVDEMAELAETLINLQSLKEKVTKKSETVGGPVDVAIITKNEGLIWAKRKHFFDIDLNSRFALRQQARLG